MGHIRLGKLPRTRKWVQVIDQIGGGAETSQIAASTMEASQGGFANAANDPGLVHTVWLLTQIPLAAQKDDFARALRSLGMDVSDTPSVFEVTSAFTGAIDDHLRYNRGRTDLGEMAQMAAVETLAAFGTPKSTGLFGPDPDEVQKTFKGLSTQVQFAGLAREFFTRLTKKYLTFFLSRELSNHVEGGGKGRFANIGEHTKFNEALALHCQQATRIVQEFSGGWYSKANFEGGITPEKTSGFVSYALTKLREELAQGAKP